MKWQSSQTQYKFFKVKNKNKCDQDFLGNNVVSNIKKAKFCTNYFFTELNIFWIRVRMWIRNRIRNFSTVGSGTRSGINSSRSTTLIITSRLEITPLITLIFLQLRRSSQMSKHGLDYREAFHGPRCNEIMMKHKQPKVQFSAKI